MERSGNTKPSPSQRLAEFYRRLALRLPASSFEEAYDLLSATLDEVEDELSGVPNDPASWKFDGRMYPPLADNWFSVEGRSVTRMRTKYHNVFIGWNGAIEIRLASEGKGPSRAIHCSLVGVRTEKGSGNHEPTSRVGLPTSGCAPGLRNLLGSAVSVASAFGLPRRQRRRYSSRGRMACRTGLRGEPSARCGRSRPRPFPGSGSRLSPRLRGPRGGAGAPLFFSTSLGGEPGLIVPPTLLPLRSRHRGSHPSSPSPVIPPFFA